MQLTIEKNHKLIKTVEHPELERLFLEVGKELQAVLKGLAYEGIKHEIELYNTYDELERKLSIFNIVHCATIETELEKFEIFIKR
jgi:hypothetical protein